MANNVWQWGAGVGGFTAPVTFKGALASSATSGLLQTYYTPNPIGGSGSYSYLWSLASVNDTKLNQLSSDTDQTLIIQSDATTSPGGVPETHTETWQCVITDLNTGNSITIAVLVEHDYNWY